MGTQTHFPPKFSFSSDFGHFIWKMLENTKSLNVSRTKLLKYVNFWGSTHAVFKRAGVVTPTPPPPSATPLVPVSVCQ